MYHVMQPCDAKVATFDAFGGASDVVWSGNGTSASSTFTLAMYVNSQLSEEMRNNCVSH